MAHLRNIEIKARLKNKEAFDKIVETAKSLTNSDGEIFKQRDVFFKVPQGRLKLRFQPPGPAMLIQYNRPNTTEAKLSQFNIFKAPADAELLEQMLTESLGALGIVEKTRTLFMYNNTRLHLDEVVGLGFFFELEVCLKPEESIETGTKMAEILQNKFGIKKEQLMKAAYMDELMEKKE